MFAAGVSAVLIGVPEINRNSVVVATLTSARKK